MANAPQQIAAQTTKAPMVLNKVAINISKDTENTILEFGECSNLNNTFTESFFSTSGEKVPVKRRSNKTKSSIFSYESSDMYRIIIQSFSSGVTLRELTSIAVIICKIVPKISEPSRMEKRCFNLLIEWFASNWELISPVLPFIHLCDENKKVINGERELIEMHTHSKK